MTFQKTKLTFLTAAVLVFLLWETSVAAEKWRTVTWDGGPVFMAEFEALCAERELTSSDVLEVNGWLNGELPARGEELLVPESKSDLFAVWMEVQNRKGGARPLVTVKLHGVPSFMRGTNMPPEERFKETSPAPAKPDKAESTEIAAPPEDRPQDQTLSSIFDPALASQDIIIPNPPALKPMIGPPPVTQGKMMWPVSGKVTSGFGRRGRRRMHDGIDIPMPKGTPIAAALDGVVTDTATNRDRSYRGYGNTVVIDHGNGIVTLYAHCSRHNVKKGQAVRQGETVGFVGNTGRTTTHHVHFEVRKNGTAVNPIPYLMGR